MNVYEHTTQYVCMCVNTTYMRVYWVCVCVYVCIHVCVCVCVYGDDVLIVSSGVCRMPHTKSRMQVFLPS